MTLLTYTLVADGPSDRCLLPIINWTIANAPSHEELSIDSQFADFRDAPETPQSLTEKIRRAVQEYPCDVLFVHRDAEREEPARRRDEIEQAAREAGVNTVVCIVPVRMSEAWLLFDESAIRRAAGNPHGNVALKLPPIQRIESQPDPKALLQNALMTASESSGRRLKQFQRDLRILRHRVAELIEDFSPLRSLSAFQDFERDVHAILAGTT